MSGDPITCHWLPGLTGYHASNIVILNIATHSYGLCITIQHQYGHRSLGDMLSKFGFLTARTWKMNDNVDSFLQWIADNVDHETETHPGNNTVHMMGITGRVTSGARNYHTLKRRNI